MKWNREQPSVVAKSMYARRPLRVVALASLWAAAGCVGGAGCEQSADERLARADRLRVDACRDETRPRVSIPTGTGAFGTGGYANLLAVGGDSLWMPLTTESAPERVELLRLDISSGSAHSQRYRGTGEARVRVGAGAVWLADPEPGTLTRIELATGRISSRRPLGAELGPRELALGAGRVWLLPSEGSFVGEIEPLSMRLVRRLALDAIGETGDIAVEGGTLWISAPEDGAVVRVDARSGRRIGEPIHVGGEPFDIEARDGDVWVDLGENADLLAHIDGLTGSLIGRARSGGSVFAIALGHGSVWATNYGPDTVTRIDADSGRRVGRPIATGLDPKGIVAGAGALWVANAGDCTVTRIEP